MLQERIFIGAWLFLTVLPRPTFAVRLVSTSPKLTEWVFQLGKGADLVATSEQSYYPEAAKVLPSIGPYFMPGVEVTLKYRPDWVLLDTSADSPYYQRAMESHGVKVLRIHIESLKELEESSLVFLETVYGEKKNEQLEKFRASLKVFDAQKKKKFSYILFAWPSPPVLFGTLSFLSDLLTRLGGTNLAKQNWKQTYPQVSDEWVMLQKPDLVVFIPYSESDSVEMREKVSKWWIGKQPRILELSPEKFARASFTPLQSASEIEGALEGLP